jgi:hypothetical protein
MTNQILGYTLSLLTMNLLINSVIEIKIFANRSMPQVLSLYPTKK